MTAFLMQITYKMGIFIYLSSSVEAGSSSESTVVSVQTMKAMCKTDMCASVYPSV